VGTWGRGSQWCNRLLWINGIHWGRFFFGRGGEGEKGGDEIGGAQEEVMEARGQTLLSGYAQRYKNA
jgi:hypothetical protein